MDRHGDIECFVEHPGNEEDIDHLEVFHPHGDPSKPKLLAISTIKEP